VLGRGVRYVLGREDSREAGKQGSREAGRQDKRKEGVKGSKGSIRSTHISKQVADFSLALVCLVPQLLCLVCRGEKTGRNVKDHVHVYLAGALPPIRIRTQGNACTHAWKTIAQERIGWR